jgi:hypothetical protein
MDAAKRRSRAVRRRTGLSIRVACADLDVLILVEVGVDHRPPYAAPPDATSRAGAEAGSTRGHGVVAHV